MLLWLSCMPACLHAWLVRPLADVVLVLVLVMGAGASEPSPRWNHYSAAVETKLYVWGGDTKDFSKDESKLTSTLHVFDLFTESWKTKSTTGASPPGVTWGASATAGHHLYQYGGYGSSSQSSLHHLDTTTSHWTKLPEGPAKRKIGCCMVRCKDMLVLFGGLSDGGLTDELHVFNLKTSKELYLIPDPAMIPLTTCLGTWSSPVVSGTRPPPCEDFSLTMIDEDHAVLFGGDQSGGAASGDVYILDITTMVS